MLLHPLVSSASTQLAKSLMPSESSTSATDSLVSGAESILDSSKTSQPSTSQQKTTQATASSAKASASVEKPTQAKESSASSSKEAAARVEKLLRSAIANWEQKNERKAESGELFVTQIFVDGGATLKRMRPAPQGRGYRIRKRSNHVTLFVGAKSNNEDQN